MAVDELAARSAAESPLANDVNVLPMSELVAPPESDGAPSRRPGRHQRRWVAGRLVALALLLIAATAVWFAFGAPQYQQQKLTTALREQGLAGQFSSDAAAVAHAQSVCRSLDNGGAQQGPKEDAVAISIYCGKYESGFKVLTPIEVEGSFTLNDSDPSVYSTSITGDSSSCQGGGGYSDISPGAEVVVKNGSGTVLTTTQLGTGTGSPPTDCEFKFAFTVMDGSESGYSITVSHRGELHFTPAKLKIPNAVALTLGN
jgi:hypothetical protein